MPIMVASLVRASHVLFLFRPSSSDICILLLNDNQFTGRVDLISPSFFRPFCLLNSDPFLPALLLANNRLSCALPVRPPNAPIKMNNSAALALCNSKVEPQRQNYVVESKSLLFSCQFLFNSSRHYSTMYVENPLMRHTSVTDEQRTNQVQHYCSSTETK